MITPVRTTARGWIWLAFAVMAWPLFGQVTESPYTVAPGRMLLEVDGLKLSYDRADSAGNKHTAVVVASTILTAGLTNAVDLQVGADLFLRETFEFRGARDTRSGVGSASFRFKWTFWRDEKLGAAMAVIPYVKAPTGSGRVTSDSIEGGIIVPWAMQLGGVVTGAMFQWDVIRNPDDTGYDGRWSATGFAERRITRALGLYGEATLMGWTTGLSDWAGTVGVGALFQVTGAIQLDYELQRGLNRRATDWTHVFRVNWGW